MTPLSYYNICYNFCQVESLFSHNQMKKNINLLDFTNPFESQLIKNANFIRKTRYEKVTFLFEEISNQEKENSI